MSAISARAANSIRVPSYDHSKFFVFTLSTHLKYESEGCVLTNFDGGSIDCFFVRSNQNGRFYFDWGRFFKIGFLRKILNQFFD